MFRPRAVKRKITSLVESDQSSGGEAVEKSESKTVSAGTRVVGPMKSAASIRVTSRFDYQADICKDYKETGYCGFGDSCKFLHDRSDFKSGWQIDKEWQQQQKKKDVPINRDVEPSGNLECGVCKLAWAECATDPCRAICGHCFCEACFVKYCSQICKTCKKATRGVFKPL